MGQYGRINVAIDRVSIEGAPDNSATSLFGFNADNGIIYAGELPRSATPFDYYYISGTLTVRNSSFKTMADGVSQDGFVHDSMVTIGGGRSEGNVFANLYTGIDIEASESSVIEIANNSSSSIGDFGAGMWVTPWLPAFVPSAPSQYFIHDNTITAKGLYAEGILLRADPNNPWIHAAVYNNIIDSESTAGEGIGAYNVQDSAVVNNTVTGAGADAIGLWGTSQTGVLLNNLSGYTADPSLGQGRIYLDTATTLDIVICGEPSDTVVNQGTNNKVIGCQQPGAASNAAKVRAADRTSARWAKILGH